MELKDKTRNRSKVCVHCEKVFARNMEHSTLIWDVCPKCNKLLTENNMNFHQAFKNEKWYKKWYGDK